MRRVARCRPWAGVAWWKTSRTCPVKVGDFDTDMRFICCEGLTEAFLLTLREPITRGAQKITDLVEGIALAPAVTQGVLLDAAAHLTWGIAGELDDMEGIEDAGCVLELIVDGVLAVPGRGSSVAIWIPERNCSPRSSSQFSCTVPDLPGTGSTQAGRGVILPACQVYDAGEFTWAPVASVLVVPHVSHQPPIPVAWSGFVDRVF